MGIESFADSGNDIGSDVQEVQDSDMDFGDGDGVNEFDEDYNKMKMETEQKLEDFDYSETSKEVSAEQIQPQETEQNPEEASLDPSKQAEDMLADFDDEMEEELNFLFKEPSSASYDRYAKTASSSSSKAMKAFCLDNIHPEQRVDLDDKLSKFPALGISLGEKLLYMLGLSKTTRVRRL